MTDKTYNGWKNYETWCVSLWLDNDQGTYRYWREQTRQRQKEAPQDRFVKEGIWNEKQAAVFRLADQLKEEVTNESPLDEASLFSDLLFAALSEVDWKEISEHWLSEMEDGRKTS